jgi:hypothetical protein
MRPVDVPNYKLRIFIEQKWIVVNVGYVNECVKIYKDYIGVFISCPELLCMACSKYHKALTAT